MGVESVLSVKNANNSQMSVPGKSNIFVIDDKTPDLSLTSILKYDEYNRFIKLKEAINSLGKSIIGKKSE